MSCTPTQTTSGTTKWVCRLVYQFGIDTLSTEHRRAQYRMSFGNNKYSSIHAILERHSCLPEFARSYIFRTPSLCVAFALGNLSSISL
mmetsp:Transcript_20336/g.56145  ORF Transcript_20336/g.56145 Transcript_20336/m.56145 type:complete len:88 (+) Transcript_20336:1318-1581(+)